MVVAAEFHMHVFKFGRNESDEAMMSAPEVNKFFPDILCDHFNAPYSSLSLSHR
jgi:hypothetical protein